ncbi:unnamed protein product, partial [Rotaria sp. Silwood1]
MVPLALAPLGL